MSKRAVPFSTAGGRKWITLWWLQALGLLIATSVFLKAWFLKELETDQLVQIYALMATIAGAFIGVQGAVDFRAAGQSPAVAESNPPTDVPPDIDSEEEDV